MESTTRETDCTLEPALFIAEAFDLSFSEMACDILKVWKQKLRNGYMTNVLRAPM